MVDMTEYFKTEGVVESKKKVKIADGDKEANRVREKCIMKLRKGKKK